MVVSSVCLLKSASENYAVHMKCSETLKSGGSMTGVKAYRASNPAYNSKICGRCMQANCRAHGVINPYSLWPKLAVSVLYVVNVLIPLWHMYWMTLHWLIAKSVSSWQSCMTQPI